jgi:tRNA(Glu) U13 pseudouridine synthase TruD
MATHPETNNKVDDSKHDDCIEMLKEVLDHAREAGYPNHWEQILEALIEEAEEYEMDEKEVEEDHLEEDAEALKDIKEDVEEMEERDAEEEEDEDEDPEDSEDEYESKDSGPKDGNPDEELNKFASEELKKKGIKPLMHITIGVKPKK